MAHGVDAAAVTGPVTRAKAGETTNRFATLCGAVAVGEADEATSISFVTEGAESRQDVLVVMVLRTGCRDGRLERLCPSLRNFECRSRRHRGLGVMLRLDCVLGPRLLSVHRGIRNARLRYASIYAGGSFLTLGCGGAVSVLKQFRQGFLDGADSPGETKTFGKS